MIHSELNRVEELFHQAADLPPDERGRFLDRQEPADSPVRRQVDALLRHLDHDALSSLSALEAFDDPDFTGSAIGHYKVLHRLGEGGFATVYLAEQVEPLRRRLALKILKPGMDSRKVIARFEAERQALAMMEHPNIARVFDAGSTENGLPYFVMELVEGKPITRYCDENRLPVPDRLRLFGEVCRAVQHAHQKGVIHRDLKPSNVLVAVQDGKPVPKVIDFGIAKATENHLGDGTCRTGLHQLVGTLEYMSPEQVDLARRNVDTRTDIYSLGIVLYELLTGRQPFDRERLLQSDYAELRRVIREVPATRPSVRVNRSEARAGKIAGARGVTPSGLARELRGDLDWIVMKALEKDRSRRYVTAIGLAEDVERHLRSEPVQASPPSVLYRVGKFVRRHRLRVFAGSVTGLAILTVVILSIIMHLQVSRVRSRLAKEQAGAEIQAAKARNEAEVARIQAEKAQALRSMLKQTISSVYPEKTGRREIPARLILDTAARMLDEGALTGQPESEADVRTILGNTYDVLGYRAAAIEHYRAVARLEARAYGETALETLKGKKRLACWLASLGQHREAEALLADAVERAGRERGEQHPLTLLARTFLADLFRVQGRFREAERLYRRALDALQRTRIETHSFTLYAIKSLALLQAELRRHGDAERLFRRLARLWRRKKGVHHGDYLDALDGLAGVLCEQREFSRAERCFDVVLEESRSRSGEHGIRTLGARMNFAVLLERQGRLAEAESQYREILAVRHRKLGDEHDSTINTMVRLAWILSKRRQDAEAEALYEQALDRYERLATRQDVPFLVLNRYACLLLACPYSELRDPEKGLAVAERADAISAGRHPAILDTLAVAHYRNRRLDEAIQTSRRLISVSPPVGRNLAVSELRLLHWLGERRGMSGILEASMFILAARVATDKGSPTAASAGRTPPGQGPRDPGRRATLASPAAVPARRAPAASAPRQ